MKKLNRRIDRFCYNHPKFGIPRLALYLVIASAASFLLYKMDTTSTYLSFISFNPYAILHGQVWRLVSWILCPIYSRLFSMLISLYFYYFIGSTLEDNWGAARFTIYCLIGVLLYIIFGFAIYFINGAAVYLTANYLYLSMFFAFAVLYPNQQVLLFFFIPIKVKWFALLDAAVFIYAIAVSGFPMLLLPVLAVVNFLIFCGGDLMDYARRSQVFGGRLARRGNVIDFKKETKKYREVQDNAPYRHKCCVCGRTDISDPGLEFRYCSQCEGYHCFCADHINNHIHFKE